LADRQTRRFIIPDIEGKYELFIPKGGEIFSAMGIQEKLMLFAFVDPKQTATEKVIVSLFDIFSEIDIDTNKFRYIDSVAFEAGCRVVHVFIWYESTDSGVSSQPSGSLPIPANKSNGLLNLGVNVR
jgi:hypothetical protein